MMETAIREILPYDINTVWTVLRNVEDYPEWRSDVSKIALYSLNMGRMNFRLSSP